MVKFKKGDTVRRINSGWADVSVGDICTVSEVTPGGSIKLHGFPHGSYEPGNFELVAFQQGDKVRRLSGPNLQMAKLVPGNIYEVEWANEDSIKVVGYDGLFVTSNFVRVDSEEVVTQDPDDGFAAEPTKEEVCHVVFIMDVSGSMGSDMKLQARLTFESCIKNLGERYENVEATYIRHHTSAKVVDADEFYNSRETGGTIVSSALKKALDEVRDIPRGIPVYVMQITDGDNWNDDSKDRCAPLYDELTAIVDRVVYLQVADREGDIRLEESQIQDVAREKLGKEFCKQWYDLSTFTQVITEAHTLFFE